ncbi:uncharacterized protein SAPINGB_P002341 [Magnusiomyces paraingens]|uniref:Uncharacterized protein n=1 Tax=Magnusiomyces paraingens TaxID=2606893 RepID=A0A5E8BDB5_9ASCO|nr:uncharacterized protein SAPINGB_P002341 [Saprochaete ingens]VVT49583.1 unnamed protein product [Saprochaete ingens]
MNHSYSLLSPEGFCLRKSAASGTYRSSENVGLENTINTPVFFKTHHQLSEESTSNSITSESRPGARSSLETPGSSVVMLPPDTTSSTQPGTAITTATQLPGAKFHSAISLHTNETNSFGGGSRPSLSAARGSMVTPPAVIGISDHHRGPSILRQKSRSITGYGSGVSFRSSAKAGNQEMFRSGGSIGRNSSVGSRTRAQLMMTGGSRRGSVYSGMSGSTRKRKFAREEGADDEVDAIIGPEGKVIMDFWNASSMLIEEANKHNEGGNRNNEKQKPHSTTVHLQQVQQPSAAQRILMGHVGKKKSNSDKSSRASKQSRQSKRSNSSNNKNEAVTSGPRKRLSIAAAAAVFRRIGGRVRTATRSFRKRRWHGHSGGNNQNELVKLIDNTVSGNVSRGPLLVRVATEKSLKSLKDMEEEYRMLIAFAEEGIEGVENLRQQQQQQQQEVSSISASVEQTDLKTSQTVEKQSASAPAFNSPQLDQGTIRTRYPTPPPNRRSSEETPFSPWNLSRLRSQDKAMQSSRRHRDNIFSLLLSDENNYLNNSYGQPISKEEETDGSASTGFTGVTALTGPLNTGGYEGEVTSGQPRAMLTKRHSIHDFPSRNGTRQSIRPSSCLEKNKEEETKKEEVTKPSGSFKKSTKDHFFLADTVPESKKKKMLKATENNNCDNEVEGSEVFSTTDGTNGSIPRGQLKETQEWNEWIHKHGLDRGDRPTIVDDVDAMNAAMTAQRLSSFHVGSFDSDEEIKKSMESLTRTIAADEEREKDKERRQQRDKLVSMGVIYDGYKSEEEEKTEESLSLKQENNEKREEAGEVSELPQTTPKPNSSQSETLIAPPNSAETPRTVNSNGLTRHRSSSILRANTSANAVSSRVPRRRDEIESFWVSKPRLPFGWTVERNIKYPNSINWHEIYFRWCSRCKASERVGQNVFFKEIVQKSRDLYCPELEELEMGDYGVASMYYTADDIPRTLWGDQVLSEQFDLAKWVVDEEIERREFRRVKRVVIARNILTGRWGVQKRYKGVPEPHEIRVQEDGTKRVRFSHQYEFSGATRTAEVGNAELADKLPTPVAIQGYYGGVALPSGFPRTNLAWATYLCKKKTRLTRRLAILRMNKKLDKYRLRILEQQLVFEQPQLRKRRGSSSSQGSLGGTCGAVGIELGRKLNEARRLAFGFDLEGIEVGSEEEKRWMEEYERVRILNKRSVRKFSDEYEGFLRRMIEHERHERILIEEASAVRERSLKASLRLHEGLGADYDDDDNNNNYNNDDIGFNSVKRVWKKHFDVGFRQEQGELARVELHSNGMSRNNSRATERSLSFLGYSGSSRNMRSAEQQFIAMSAKIPSELLSPRRRPSSARRLVNFVSGSNGHYQQNESNVRSMLLNEEKEGEEKEEEEEEDKDKEKDGKEGEEDGGTNVGGALNGTRTNSKGLGCGGACIGEEGGGVTDIGTAAAGAAAAAAAATTTTTTTTESGVTIRTPAAAVSASSRRSGGVDKPGIIKNRGSARLDSSGTICTSGSNGSLTGILKRPGSCSVRSMIIEGSSTVAKRSGGSVIGVITDNEGWVYGSPVGRIE